MGKVAGLLGQPKWIHYILTQVREGMACVVVGVARDSAMIRASIPTELNGVPIIVEKG